MHCRWLERNSKGTWIIRSEYRDAGFSLLESLYDDEGNAEGWELYERYIAAWQSGATRSPFPRDKLPKEVIVRQSCGADPEFADEFAVPPTTGATRVEKPKKGETK